MHETFCFHLFGAVHCSCFHDRLFQNPLPRKANPLRVLPGAAQSASQPVQEEEPYNAALLTGLEKVRTIPKGRRFTAVMVNNISEGSTQQARPQAGLSDADILVEIKAEGGITRFMALYENYETMPRVGPVRSARHQFFQLILPFHRCMSMWVKAWCRQSTRTTMITAILT